MKNIALEGFASDVVLSHTLVLTVFDRLQPIGKGEGERKEQENHMRHSVHEREMATNA